MKSFLRSASALILGAASFATVYGQSFDNVAGTFSWSVGNESNATVTDEVAAALQESKVTVGTDLSITSTSATYNLTPDGGDGTTTVTVGPMCTYQPATSNPGCVPTDMIEYTVKLQKGLTITPTSVSFDAVKEGTDNAYFSWSYTIDGVESDIVNYDNPKEQIRRNNNANPSAPINHNEAITAEGGRVMTLRLYISSVANNKKMSLGNIKINGIISGTVEARAFKNFKLDFRSDPYTVVEPETGLPEGVELVAGTFHDGQHGYQNAKVKVAVDGPVKFTVAGCQYSNQATVTDAEGNVLATLDTRGAGCDTNTSTAHYVTWTYNSETPTTLTIDLGSYCPFLYAEACDLIPLCTVRYFDTDGKTLIGETTVEGGSALAYAYGEADVTVAEGYKFRGWFNSTQSTAVKMFEGVSVQENISLYAKASEIEVPTNTSRYIYELNKTNFYIEDHEAIWNNGGSFHDGQHGWAFGNGNSLSLAVAGNCIVTVGNCKYSSESNAVVTNAAGQQIASFPVNAETDGASYTFEYASEQADTLTITFGGTTYVHKVTVYNVVDFVEFDELTGYYIIPANDANSFLIALASANATGNVKIFLPNGTYDLGQLCLTNISGNNISIIGESMEGTIIVNAPLVENEGIGTTATLLNTSNNLYLQDLTLQNALDYYKSGSAGRAVCLQDKGQNTICKNVRMLSYQDTYYSNRASNFYWEDSEIHGTVDYLCGDGNVVYNRVQFVNESRSKDGKSGSDVLCAPYNTATTADRYNWGYVFLDCSIKSESNDFTYARAWGGESKAQFIRTTILDGSLNASRWTAAGMNVAASAFKEYKTMDAEGNIISPESYVMNFTHSSGNREFETILTDEEAAQFTIENIYGEWAPDQTAAQVEIASDEECVVEDAIYMISNSTIGEETEEGFIDITPGAYIAEALNYLSDGDTFTVRAANGRGGFGPAYTYIYKTPTTIEQIQPAAPQHEVSYNLFGQRTNGTKGIFVVNGQKVIK